MIERQTGHVVCISSVQGKIAIPHRSAYNASKHALQAFCDTIRAELAEKSIKVSVINPGYIQTALSLNAVTQSGQTYGGKRFCFIFQKKLFFDVNFCFSDGQNHAERLHARVHCRESCEGSYGGQEGIIDSTTCTETCNFPQILLAHFVLLDNGEEGSKLNLMLHFLLKRNKLYSTIIVIC